MFYTYICQVRCKVDISQNFSNKKISTGTRKGNEYEKLFLGLKCLEMLQDSNIEYVYHEVKELLPFDDIVVVSKDKIECYQTKHSINNNEFITYDDILNEESELSIKRYKTPWLYFLSKKNLKDIIFHIYSNKSPNEELANALNGEFLCTKIIENTNSSRRKKLKKVAEFDDEDNFTNLLKSLRFDLKKENKEQLEDLIEIKLKDLFGNSYKQEIFEKYKNKISDWFLESNTREITKQDIEKALNINNASVSQEFDIDDSFIENTNFQTELKTLINQNHSYLNIIGTPGSGKSTFITNYIEENLQKGKKSFIKYFCYTNIKEDIYTPENRANKNRFLEYFIKQFWLKFNHIIGLNDPARYDYSEENFLKCLKVLGDYFKDKKEKLLIIIDGLDHTVRASIPEFEKFINILPKPENVPNGIIWIITSQGKKYLREDIKFYCEQNSTIIELPTFDINKTSEYFQKAFKNKPDYIDIINPNLQSLQKKSEGLPLYLKYIKDFLDDSALENLQETINNIPQIVNKEISYYYNILWIEHSENIEFKKLCSTISLLEFNITKDNLFNICKIDIFNEKPFDYLKHLLKRNDDETYQIFHNSFREFVKSKLDNSLKATINQNIFIYLEGQEKFNKIRFNYIYTYAYRLGNYRFIFDSISTEFIDDALINGFNEEELYNLLDVAINATKKTLNFTELSKIVFLRSEVSKRFEYHINKIQIYKTYLAAKDFDKIFNLISKGENILDLNIDIASILIDLSQENLTETYKKKCFTLAKDFFNKFLQLIDNDPDYDGSLDNKIYELASIYHSKPLFLTNIVENAIQSMSNVEEWQINQTLVLFKKIIGHLYSNNRFDFLLSLRKEIEDEKLLEVWYIETSKLKLKNNNLHGTKYIKNAKSHIKSEESTIKYLSLLIQANIQQELIIEYLGDIKLFPDIDTNTSYYSKAKEKFSLFRDYINILLYCDKQKEINFLKNEYLFPLDNWLKVYYYANIELLEAINSKTTEKILDVLNRLIDHKKGEHERIFESFAGIKSDLSIFLEILIDAYLELQGNIIPLIDVLKNLGKSELIDYHYGIGLVDVDYGNELAIIKILSKHPINNIKTELNELLTSIENKVQEEVIETQGRVEHYFILSELAYKCGFNQLGSDYIKQGFLNTKGYFNRKDATLFELIESTENIISFFPEKIFQDIFINIGRCINWTNQITDGKSTKNLPKSLFGLALKYDYKLASALLIKFQEHIGGWILYDCIEQYLKESIRENPLLTYFLSEFVPLDTYSTNGNPHKDRFDIRIKIFEDTINKAEPETSKWLYEKLLQYILCEITEEHRYYYIDSFNKVLEKTSFKKLDQIYKFKSYDVIGNNPQEDLSFDFEGKKYTKEEIIAKSSKDFNSYEKIYLVLKEQRQSYLLEKDFEQILKSHIQKVQTQDELNQIAEFILNDNAFGESERIAIIADKYKCFGNIEKYIEFHKKAFSTTIRFGFGNYRSINYASLEKLIAYNENETFKFLFESIAELARTDYVGRTAPEFILRILSKYGNSVHKAQINLIHENFYRDVLKEFDCLPQKEFSLEYEWIKNYKTEFNMIFEDVALDILFDQWKAYSYNKRLTLTHFLNELAIKQPQIIIDKLIKLLKNENFTLKEQASFLLKAIVKKQKQYLISYKETFEQIIKENYHYSITNNLIDVITILDQPLAKKLIKITYLFPVQKQEIIYPNLKSSSDFNKYILSHTGKYFKEPINRIINILDIDKDLFYWKIEQEIKKIEPDFKSIEEIGSELHRNYSSDYSGYTPYENPCNHYLYHGMCIVLDKILKNQTYPELIHKQIWNLIEYFEFYSKELPLKDLQPKSRNINLLPEEKDNNLKNWFEFKDCKTTKRKLTEEWVTLYQKYTLSKDLLNEYVEIIPYFYRKGHKHHIDIIDKDTKIAFYYRFYELAQLKEEWIEKYKLEYDSNTYFDYNLNGEKAIQYMLWQDGIDIGSYKYDILGYGTQLNVSKQLIEKIMSENDFYLTLVKYVTRKQRVPRYKSDIKEREVEDKFVEIIEL